MSRLAVPAVLACASLSACAADGDDMVEEGPATCWETSRIPKHATRVEVSLKEWNISLSSEDIKAGDVSFIATNHGTMLHEMLVVRAEDLASLPIGSDGKLDEDRLAEDNVIGEIAEFAAGDTCAHNFRLTPGKYVLFCNIAEGDTVHLKRGMIHQFTVSA